MGKSHYRQQILTICVVVALSTAYLWCKVEMASAASSIERATCRHQALVEEKSRQVAAIALVKKPSAIAHLARERLQMVHPPTTLELELPNHEVVD